MWLWRSTGLIYIENIYVCVHTSNEIIIQNEVLQSITAFRFVTVTAFIMCWWYVIVCVCKCISKELCAYKWMAPLRPIGTLICSFVVLTQTPHTAQFLFVFYYYFFFFLLVFGVRARERCAHTHSCAHSQLEQRK